MVNPMDKTDKRTIAQGGSMRSVHVFETLRGDKISNVKGDTCNPWRFSPSIDRVICLGGHPKEGWLMEGPYPNPCEVSMDWACWRPHLSLLKIAAEYQRMDKDPWVSGFSCWNFNLHDDDQLWGNSLAIDQMIKLFRGRDLTADEEVFMNLCHEHNIWLLKYSMFVKRFVT